MTMDDQLKPKTSPLNFQFKVNAKESKEYLKKLKTLFETKKSGDWETVSLMTGIETANARMSFMRIDSKHHAAVVEALEKIIEQRNNLINN